MRVQAKLTPFSQQPINDRSKGSGTSKLKIYAHLSFKKVTMKGFSSASSIYCLNRFNIPLFQGAKDRMIIGSEG